MSGGIRHTEAPKPVAQRRLTSRFRTCQGTLIGWAGVPYILASVWTTCWLGLTGKRTALPFISFRATRRFRKLLGPTSRVLEFGSGMSTLWFARHCGELVSVETDASWYAQTSDRLQRQRNVAKVDYRLSNTSDLGHCLDDRADEWFDLALIDGPGRALAVITALKKVRRNGYIYLDNTDLPASGNLLARQVLLGATGLVETFIDFTPCRMNVTEGMLARVPGRSTNTPLS